MKSKHFLLALILFVYAGLYIATSTPDKCDNDCERVNQTSQYLRQNRPYVAGLMRCTYRQGSDTLCVYVRDTTGIDWNLFADTACMAATQNGLPRQKIFIIKAGVTPPDTVVKKVCP